MDLFVFAIELYELTTHSFEMHFILCDCTCFIT